MIGTGMNACGGLLLLLNGMGHFVLLVAWVLVVGHAVNRRSEWLEIR